MNLSKYFLRNRRAYLDRAAGASGNPSSPHEEGRRAKRMLEDARTAIARLIEVQPDDVIFTSGATEANALAILGIARTGDHVFYLSTAHASIVENMKLLAEKGVEVEELPIKDYRVDIEKLAKMIRPETKLISMDAVCGETGIVWNTREIASVLQTRSVRQLGGHSVSAAFSAPVLHIDASQAPLTEKISRAHFGADLLTFDASKIGPVRGIGALVAHRTIPLAPLYAGGGQERGLRPGSESPELARAFAAALQAAVRNRGAFRASAEQERRRLTANIKAVVPDVHIQEGVSQAPHILSFSLPGCDTDYLVALLDEAGFAVSTRSACETNSEEGSRAVFVLTGDRVRAQATLRVSWGSEIRPRDLVRFAAALLEAYPLAGGIDSRSQG